MGYLSLLTKLLRKNFLLTLIILLGFSVRLLSTNPGYYYPHGDELLYGEAIYMITHQTLSLESQYFGFPPLVPWIMVIAFMLFFLPLVWLKTLIIHALEAYLFIVPILVFILLTYFIVQKITKWDKRKLIAAALLIIWFTLIASSIFVISYSNVLHREILGPNWIDALYWGRYLTAFVGSAAIFLVYLVTLNFFKSKRTAFLAATFVALDYRLILNSHVGLPDMYNVFFLLLSLYCINKLLSSPTFKQYLITIFSLAVFFMIKYQPHVLIPFSIAHIIISYKQSGGKLANFLKKLFAPKVMFSALIGLIFILAAHTYHFQNWSKVMEINAYEAIKYDFGRNIVDIYPISYLYHIAIGPLLSIAALLGLFLGLIKRGLRIKTIILVSFLPSFAFLYLYYTGGGYFTRNFISAIPLILILSALFVDWIWQKVENSKIKLLRNAVRVLIGILLIGLLKDHLANDFVMAKFYSSEPPLKIAQKWVDQNIPENVTYGRYGGNPAPSNPKINVENFLTYGKAFSYPELLKEKYNYISIEFAYLRGSLLWWTRQPTKMGLKFWNKPDNLLSQGYYALAFRELLWNNAVALFSSPWQAPSHSFAIIKVDKDLYQFDTKTIKRYETFEDWKPLYFLQEYKDQLQQSTTGLLIKQGQNMPGSIRWQSNTFPVKPEFGYKLTGTVLTSSTIPQDERDGFLRIDFYSSSPNLIITSRPIFSSVSERIFGDKGPHEIEFNAIVPENAGYATISLQSDGNSKSSFELKSLEVEESLNPHPSVGKHLTIPDQDLFLPNNEGIL